MEQCPQLQNCSLAWVCIKNANRTRDFHLGKTFLPSILNNSNPHLSGQIPRDEARPESPTGVYRLASNMFTKT